MPVNGPVPHAMPRWIHRVLLSGGILAVMWGALAFGAVYPWAYRPLAYSCAAIGVLALLVERRGQPPILGLAAGLAAIGLAIGVQLVPLSVGTIERVSPGTAAFLNEFDFSFRLARAVRVGAVLPGSNPSYSHPLSIDPPKTVEGILLFGSLALFLLGMTRVVSVVGARRVANPLIFFGTLLALIGIAQRGLTATDAQPLIYGFWRPQYTSTPFGPFVNPNHFAGWMLMGLPFALTVFFDRLQRAMEAGAFRRERFVSFLSSPGFAALMMLGLACLVMALSLLMTRARSGLAAFAFGVLIVGAPVFRRQTGTLAKAAVAGLVVLLLLGVGAWAGIETLTGKFTETEHGMTPLSGRLSAWGDTAQIIRDFPVAGSGFNTYGTAMVQYQSSRGAVHFQEAHNDYLQLAAEGGLLVGVPILLTLVLFVRSVRRRFQESTKKGGTYLIRIGAIAGLISIALQSMVEFSLQMPGNAALFCVLAAIALHRSPRTTTRS